MSDRPLLRCTQEGAMAGLCPHGTNECCPDMMAALLARWSCRSRSSAPVLRVEQCSITRKGPSSEPVKPKSAQPYRAPETPLTMPVIFAGLFLAPPLLRALAKEGYPTPTPIQAQSSPMLLEAATCWAWPRPAQARPQPSRCRCCIAWPQIPAQRPRAVPASWSWRPRASWSPSETY
jgi:hypothetical protein